MISKIKREAAEGDSLKKFLIQGKPSSSSSVGGDSFKISKTLLIISVTIQAETIAGRTVSPKYLIE